MMIGLSIPRPSLFLIETLYTEGMHCKSDDQFTNSYVLPEDCSL